mmetsp:Transcript_7860/g.19821  ORF Transcript_7860/g.19821 Transcript_7860/m.19821 type:complete len:211 (-) Transcript_7860:58-690(-)
MQEDIFVLEFTCKILQLRSAIHQSPLKQIVSPAYTCVGPTAAVRHVDIPVVRRREVVGNRDSVIVNLIQLLWLLACRDRLQVSWLIHDRDGRQATGGRCESGGRLWNSGWCKAAGVLEVKTIGRCSTTTRNQGRSSAGQGIPRLCPHPGVCIVVQSFRLDSLCLGRVPQLQCSQALLDVGTSPKTTRSGVKHSPSRSLLRPAPDSYLVFP